MKKLVIIFMLMFTLAFASCGHSTSVSNNADTTVVASDSDSVGVDSIDSISVDSIDTTFVK